MSHQNDLIDLEVDLKPHHLIFFPTFFYPLLTRTSPLNVQ